MGQLHGQFRSVWVGSWWGWVRFLVSLGQFGSVDGRGWVGLWSVWVSWGRSMVDLRQFRSVHGRFGSV